MASKREMDLVKLRDRIAVLNRKIEEAQEMRVPLARALERVDELVDHLAEEGAIPGEEFALQDYSRPRLDYSPETALSFLAWVDADRIRKHLHGVVSEFYQQYQGSLDTREAHTEMRADKAALFALEVEEERFIEAAEADGMSINRRADADPAAVLVA